jgi:hypothetical protein
LRALKPALSQRPMVDSASGAHRVRRLND